ncbi:MAG: sulfite exporter TauE/SafE family protein [Ruminiclostridium sp.]|nr:sulfite exporter TauE/SafE family protein [Ruminiclostridium sp.]
MNIIIGFLTGVAASMGLGGGFILIIWLTLFSGMPQAEAQGVNLLFFLPVALFSAVIHAKNKLIEWKTVPFAVIPGIIGAAVGSVISLSLSDNTLRTLFALLIIPVALREILHKKAG